MMEFIFGLYDSEGNDLSQDYNTFDSLLTVGGPTQIESNLNNLFGEEALTSKTPISQDLK